MSCGIKGTIFFRKNDPAVPSCKRHDKCYRKQQVSRARCDELFYQALCKQARAGEITQARAELYYKVVRMFGWGPWYKQKLKNWWNNAS